MEDNRTKEIDESKDELLKLVKFHVEDILYKDFSKHGIKADYKIRNDAIFHVLHLTLKKGNNPHFQQCIGQYVRYMAESFLFGYGVDSRHQPENDLDISE